MKILVLTLLYLSLTPALAEENKPSTALPMTYEIQKKSNELFGANSSAKFSYHLPGYFIFGKDDLKLQLSGKYRVAHSANLYIGYTQLMFWSIYDDSLPFKEINYNPEIFYRVVEHESNFIRSLDFGVAHNSNGKDKEESRSINRVFLKANSSRAYGQHNLITGLKLYYIFDKDPPPLNITQHLGFWELKAAFTNVITHNKSHLALEFKLYAGKKVYDLDKGGRELGLVYNFGSDNFNPALYLQYFSGYGENLIDQDKKRDTVRLGFMLFM